MKVSIRINEMRKAIVTTENNQTFECKVEPYHRNGKQMAYVVMSDEMNAPIKRYNISDFNGPIELVDIELGSRAKVKFTWNE